MKHFSDIRSDTQDDQQRTPLRSKPTLVTAFDAPSPTHQTPPSLFVTKAPSYISISPLSPPILSQTTTQQPSIHVPLISPSMLYSNSPVKFNFSRNIILKYLEEQKVGTEVKYRRDLSKELDGVSPASPATNSVECQLRAKVTDYNAYYRDLFRDKVQSPIEDSFVVVPHPHANDSRVTRSTYIKIQIVTWNMQGKSAPPRESIEKFISHVDSQHIFVFGAQECERSITSSFLFRSKQNWEAVLKELVGENYEVLASSTLVATHCIVFAHKELKPFIKDVATSEVATGFLNGSMGNKGCASVSFRVANDSFMFICSHLAAHQQNVEQRNAHYHRIIKEVDYKIRATPRAPVTGDSDSSAPNSPKSTSTTPKTPLPPKRSLFDDFDYVFFFGDLNYRVNGTRQEVDHRLSVNDSEGLLQNDQLLRSKDVGLAFTQFDEGKILFPPTYKFCKENPDQYDSSRKQRIPSWTDRVLFYNRNHHHHNEEKKEDNLEKPDGTPSLKLLEYNSVDDVKYSDHRPVLARFLCKISENDEAEESEESRRMTSSVCAIQ